jgi:sugar phosphate isomerase/epimerase
VKFGWAIWNMRGGSQSQADRCRLARELGLDFVSFNTSPQHWGKSNPGGEAGTPELLASLGLEWTVHAGLPAAAAEEGFGFLEETLDFARRAGPPLAVSFDPVCLGEKPDRRYAPEPTARALARAFDVLGRLETRIALENSPRNCDPALFEPLAARFTGLGMLLDTGHLNMFLNGDAGAIAAYLDALPLPVLDLHVHDNDGEGDQHLALGDGTLPYADLFSALRARGYAGLVTAEVTPELNGLNPDRPEDVDALRRTLELAREGLAPDT